MEKFEYQKFGQFFAQIAGGSEEIGMQELTELGATHIKKSYRGAYFEGNIETLYSVNYQSRTITRVLAPLCNFHAHNEKYLYRKAKSIAWDELFTAEETFAVFSNVSQSKIRHSQYAALVVKDAIVDYFREKFDARPSIDRQNPDVWVSLHIDNNRAKISLDTSGGSLHRRGYRQESVEAPMQETVASTAIKLAGWNGESPFYDPMCGSGTLLCEALMIKCNIPAGYLRKNFGFEHLPEFDLKNWQEYRKKCDQKIEPLQKGFIRGSDISAHAVQLAGKSCRMLPQGENIEIEQKDFRELKLENHAIFVNPPYGIRLKVKGGVEGLYQEFGDFLKHQCTGSTAFIYFAERKHISAIRLKPEWRKPLNNGDLDGRVAKFVMY